MTRTRERIPALDGLRAFAILLVMARHGVRPFWSDAGLFPLRGWDAATPLLNGWIGVDLFFGLSGFLIARHILDRGLDREIARGGFRLGPYLKRRALRIVPAYVAALLIAVSGLVPLYEVARDQLDLRIGYHLLFLQDYLPANIVVAFWSLGVEEKFYLAAPLLVLLGFRLQGRNRWLAFATLAAIPTLGRLATYFAHPEAMDYEVYFETFRSPFHLTFDGMAAGMICAFVARGKTVLSPRAAHLLFWLGTLPILALLGETPLLDAPGIFAKILLPALLAAGTGSIILGLVAGGGPRFFRSAIWAPVARLSYSLYLVHMMAIPSALALVPVEGPPWLRFVFFLPIYGALSTGAAYLLHRFIEQPFLAKGTIGQMISNHPQVTKPTV